MPVALPLVPALPPVPPGTPSTQDFDIATGDTPLQFTQAISEAEPVHVATHGVVNGYRPWESFLAFSGSTGKLPLPEISSLKTPYRFGGIVGL